MHYTPINGTEYFYLLWKRNFSLKEKYDEVPYFGLFDYSSGIVIAPGSNTICEAICCPQSNKEKKQNKSKHWNKLNVMNTGNCLKDRKFCIFKSTKIDIRQDSYGRDIVFSADILNRDYEKVASIEECTNVSFFHHKAIVQLSSWISPLTAINTEPQSDIFSGDQMKLIDICKT